MEAKQRLQLTTGRRYMLWKPKLPFLLDSFDIQEVDRNRTVALIALIFNKVDIPLAIKTQFS